MLHAPRAVLWDLDGTLVDSEEAHWLAWKITLDAEGVIITREQFSSTFGQRNASFLHSWLAVEAGDPAVERVGAAKEAAFRRMVREGHCAWMPGAPEWLERLERGRWLQAISSSAPRANVEAVLEVFGIAERFAATVAAEDVRAGKPDPQVFLETAARLSVPASRCVVVEDAAAGVEGARRAGMACVGVSARDKLAATCYVRTLAELGFGTFESLVRE
jgi:HAD superfamily hydrolase (TIGR01509 family)